MSQSIAAPTISPLRQRLIDDMNTRQFSRETQRNYIRDVGRFATLDGTALPRRCEAGQGAAERARSIPWAGGRDIARRQMQPRETTMTPLRARMIEDMILAGLAEGTREAYVGAVRQFAAFYRRWPDQLSEAEVRACLLDLRRRGAARGTFQIARAGLRFFFADRLGRVWGVFGGKKARLAAAEAAAGWAFG